jgi:hypothetical protein
MTWVVLGLVVLVGIAAFTPQGRAFVVRNVTTKMCPVCFERFPRRNSSCPVCHTSVSDFGGAPPPPNPLS